MARIGELNQIKKKERRNGQKSELKIDTDSLEEIYIHIENFTDIMNREEQCSTVT